MRTRFSRVVRFSLNHREAIVAKVVLSLTRLSFPWYDLGTTMSSRLHHFVLADKTIWKRSWGRNILIPFLQIFENVFVWTDTIRNTIIQWKRNGKLWRHEQRPDKLFEFQFAFTLQTYSHSATACVAGWFVSALIGHLSIKCKFRREATSILS